MTRTHAARRQMRAVALRRLALAIDASATERANLRWIANSARWGRVDADLRGEVRCLFGVVADYARRLADELQAGRRMTRRKR